jgi:glycosyltransferase involved in cell wall biosynthesis
LSRLEKTLKDHILFITLRSDIGGGPKHLSDLASQIKQDYPEVRFSIASPLNRPFGDVFKKLGEYHLPLTHRKFSFMSLINLWQFSRDQNVTILHSHGRGAGYYTRLLSLLTGISCVHTFHGAHREKNLAGRIKVFIDKVLAYFTSKFICVSEDERSEVKEANMCGRVPIRVIPNGVSIENIGQTAEKTPELSEINGKAIPSNKIKIGTLARLSYQKGLDLFLETLEKIEIPENYCFLIAGDGEMQEELTRKLKEGQLSQVCFLGPTFSPIEFLAQLDIYFSFARWEGLPLGVLEAMSCKLPILISDVKGHRDLAGGSLLFDPNTPTDFKNKLEDLIQRRDEFGTRAFEFVRKNHSTEKMAAQTMEWILK